MSKVQATRLENLRRLIDARGGAVSVSAELGYSNSSYLSQLAGPNPSRTIGERAARTIETALKLPEGWLDTPNADMVRMEKAQPARAMHFAGGSDEPGVFAMRRTPPPSPSSDYRFEGEIPPGPKDLPVFGSFQGGFDGSEINYQDPVDVIERPGELKGVRNACAVYVVNDSMEPRYFRGEMALVHPGRPVRQGDFVAVELTSGRGLIKRLLRRTDDYVELEQYNPPEKRKIPRKEIAGVYLIIGTRADR